jgi:outer membrane murein-binding lipoprotein Lpp
MNGKTILAVALAATLVAGAVSAQSKGGPKLYRWVDKDGKVHYDDALPPEAVNQARTEFSAKTGSVAGQVERALTPEVRAALDAAARAAAEAA